MYTSLPCNKYWADEKGSGQGKMMKSGSANSVGS